MKESWLEIIAALVFVVISMAAKAAKLRANAPKIKPSAPPDGKEWQPDPALVREFAEAQKRAGRPLDPEMAALLDAEEPFAPEPAVPAGPSEEELAMLDEQRRLAELAAELEQRRQDAMAVFAPAPAETSEAECIRPSGAVLDTLRHDPRQAVVLAELLAPPVALRPPRSC